jgi:hypothetical protein
MKRREFAVKAESKEHLKCWNIEANDGIFGKEEG